MYKVVSTNKKISERSRRIIITVDVEDWFQVENFKTSISFTDWTNKELRVDKNTYYLLDFFDKYKIKATFFILGWIAKRIPGLVNEIHLRGHEVASHGYNHLLCTELSNKDLKKDLIDSKELLEDIIGLPVNGYRAPSFSINDHILKVVKDCGYLYDSSFNSFSVHKRYGKVDLIRNIKKGIVSKVSDNLYELPISNLKLFNLILPWGGGGYFRIIPLPLFKMGVREILKREQTYLFYLHPWEIDHEQPRVKEALGLFKIRHYMNLNKTLSKLSSFIEDFKECCFVTCRQYLDNIKL